MIRVTISTNDDGMMAIEAKGHATKDPSVCASVSTIMQSTGMFLEQLSEQFPDDVQVEVKGWK